MLAHAAIVEQKRRVRPFIHRALGFRLRMARRTGVGIRILLFKRTLCARSIEQAAHAHAVFVTRKVVRQPMGQLVRVRRFSVLALRDVRGEDWSRQKAVKRHGRNRTPYRMNLLLALLGWLASAAFIAMIAAWKGRYGLGWFVLGFLFGPRALLASLIAPRAKNRDGDFRNAKPGFEPGASALQSTRQRMTRRPPPGATGAHIGWVSCCYGTELIER